MKPLNVLVVEDALDHAFLVMEFLKELGVNVTHAQDGDRAIQLFDAQYFDLVLTDLNLPGTDGFQVIEHVKSRRPALPVLAVTGYDKPEYDERAFQAGVDAILHRPLDKDEVLRQVRNLLPDLGDDEERAPAVLAVGALPGDVEAGCGGTLLKHGMDGYEVTVELSTRTVTS